MKVLLFLYVKVEEGNMRQVSNFNICFNFCFFNINCCVFSNHLNPPAHPCPNCNNVLTKLGIKQAIYTVTTGGLGAWAYNKNQNVEAPTWETARRERTWRREGGGEGFRGVM